MFRSIALAVGITMLIVGFELFFVERVVWAGNEQSTLAAQTQGFSDQRESYSTKPNDFIPPDWMPWSLMSSGAVVIIYSFTIPRRMAA